jgi:hypothetical protein
LFLVHSVAFGPGQFLCVNVDRLFSDFDFHIGVGLEVVVPVGVRIGSTFEAKTR